MKVTISFDKETGSGTCTVVREWNDQKFYGNRDAKGESRLLYHIQRELRKQGYDFIKKRMYKDNHMVDQIQQYLRQRKAVNGSQLAIWNSKWAIEGAEKAFNDGSVTLAVFDLLHEPTNVN